jgi:hypothetical protein
MWSANARAVYQDVNPAEGVHGALYQALPAVGGGNVGVVGDGAPPGFVDFFRYLVGRHRAAARPVYVATKVVDHHRCVFLGQQQRNAPSDAAPRARDDSHLSFQPISHVHLPGNDLNDDGDDLPEGMTWRHPLPGLSQADDSYVALDGNFRTEGFRDLL